MWSFLEEPILLKNLTNTLILESDAGFRNALESICSEFGKTVAVSDLGSAIGYLASQSFDLLLLDWRLCQTGEGGSPHKIHEIQEGCRWVALFNDLEMRSVVAAMKAGASEALWVGYDGKTLARKIAGIVAETELAPQLTQTLLLSKLAEILSEKAFVEGMPLIRASREFSRTFLRGALSRKRLPRNQLAHLMNVSLRTIHRHLSPNT